MTQGKPSETEVLAEALNAYYPIDVAKLELLPLGADMNASVYKAVAHDLSAYFVKWKRERHPDVSVTLLKLLHEAGIQQIIPPVKTRDGKLVSHIGDHTMIVYPYVEGIDGFTRRLTDDQWVALGRVMRQVHEFDVPESLLPSIRQENYTEKWREIVRSFYGRMDPEHGDDVLALNVRTFFKEHLKTIQRLVDQAEHLAQVSREQKVEQVLCHSDIHGGNVFIADDGAFYIVDWDDPIMAPKERDLMFIGGGVANVWNDPHEELCFYEGYGKTSINRTLLAYYRHERIVEDIAVYLSELLSPNVGATDRQEMYGHFINQFDPCGVVDIAFKTSF